MKRLLCICLLIFSVNCACGREDAPHEKQMFVYHNSIKFSFGNFYVRKSPGIELPIRQIGVYAERRLYKKLFISIGYSQWVVPWFFNNGDYDAMGISEDPITIPYNPVVGKLEYRVSYKMADGYFFYKHQIYNKHYLNVGLGLSYCWGENVHLKYYIQASPTDAKAAYEARDVHYWGALPVLAYDYMLWKNRLSVGGDIRARYYSGRPKAQYDYGLHIGVNF